MFCVGLMVSNASEVRQAGRRSRKAERVGSSPTAGSCDCLVAQRWSGPLLTGRLQVRILPGQLGRASQLARWHPVANRTRRKPLQVRVLPLPLVCRKSRAEADVVRRPVETRTRQVRFLPARLKPPWPSGDGTSLTRRHYRRFESCRGYCGVDWSLAPARSDMPSHAGSNPASATREN